MKKPGVLAKAGPLALWAQDFLDKKKPNRETGLNRNLENLISRRNRGDNSCN